MAKIKRQRGQSLLEVLLATGALGLFLMGIISVLMIGSKSARISKEKAIASGLADEKAARLREMRDILPYSFWELDSLYPSPTPEREDLGDGYWRKTFYKETDEGSSKNMMAEIRISRDDHDGERALFSTFYVLTDWPEK